ncbi:collagen alpha-1(I) chain-like [Rhinolophus ferrumequinum]|uniref:collagen alpha-1(I) chain-like n=1 Tax=Rhinolophus ferrumequinum TaxID=59479 RepID=UPI00140FE290|nr:collagen alpha-1(I) chain-like [Rhinolophus ferrumequinum]
MPQPGACTISPQCAMLPGRGQSDRRGWGHLLWEAFSDARAPSHSPSFFHHGPNPTNPAQASFPVRIANPGRGKAGSDSSLGIPAAPGPALGTLWALGPNAYHSGAPEAASRAIKGSQGRESDPGSLLSAIGVRKRVGRLRPRARAREEREEGALARPPAVSPPPRRSLSGLLGLLAAPPTRARLLARLLARSSRFPSPAVRQGECGARGPGASAEPGGGGPGREQRAGEGPCPARAPRGPSAASDRAAWTAACPPPPPGPARALGPGAWSPGRA